MDDTWNVTQYCQEDVDEKVGIATALEEDTKWWKDDGEDDFADVATINITSAMILINSAMRHLAQGQEKCCGRKRKDHGYSRG